jgi:hypothetical protein
MSDKRKVDQAIVQIETFLECWKQFNVFITLAQSKKFGIEDETQFLEVKSAITQQLEMILAAYDQPIVNRDDIHKLLSAASSLRNVSEQPSAQRVLEKDWHKIFIDLQAVLGQLKVQQKNMESKGFFASLFGGKKK